MEATKTVYCVEIVPHEYREKCYSCSRPGSRLYLCPLCNGREFYIVPAQENHRRSKSKNIYTSKIGPAQVKKYHEKCCTVNIYKSTVKWEQM